MKPYDSPFLGFEQRWRGKKEEEKMPKIVSTFVSASNQGQHTHSAQTKFKITGDGDHLKILKVKYFSHYLFNLPQRKLKPRGPDPNTKLMKTTSNGRRPQNI